MKIKELTTSDDVRIRYTDEGSGRPVLLVHGLGCRAGHWRLQREPLLAAGYRVLAVDLRFHGDSGRPAYGARVGRLGQDIGAIVEAEDLQDLILVGHSMGVSVNFAYLSLHGTERVAKLVIIDQTPRIMNDAHWEYGVRGVTWERLEAQLAGTQPWGEMHREPAPTEAVTSMLAECPMEDHFRSAHAALVMDHFVTDWRDEIARITAPVWVAAGKHAPVYPLESMSWLAEAFPNARLSVFAHSGHTPHWSEPETFNAELLRFIEE